MTIDPTTGPRTVHLHVGAMKTGTSFIQANLDNSREALAAHGVLYPGHIGRAVHDVLVRRGARHLGPSTGAWAELAAEVASWQGTAAILSMEFLGLATPEQTATIVSSLAPADVHVVVTARDLARSIPSAWQQITKNRRTTDWQGFLAAISGTAEGRDRVRKRFWQHHDTAAIVERWSTAVATDRITVVTLPARGAPASVLWERFCTAVDLDPTTFPIAENVGWNISLGYAEAEMLRRLNVELGRQIEQPQYRKIVTEFLSGDVLRGSDNRTARMVPPVLPPDVRAWAARRAARTVADLRRAGVQVVGDLAELVPAAEDADGQLPGELELDPDDVTAAAVRAVAALVLRLAATAVESATDGADDEEVDRD